MSVYRHKYHYNWISNLLSSHYVPTLSSFILSYVIQKYGSAEFAFFQFAIKVMNKRRTKMRAQQMGSKIQPENDFVSFYVWHVVKMLMYTPLKWHFIIGSDGQTKVVILLSFICEPTPINMI